MTGTPSTSTEDAAIPARTERRRAAPRSPRRRPPRTSSGSSQSQFNGYDAGSLADSWRQQPGTPAYCTELDSAQLRRALAAADKAEAPRTRDRLMEQFASLEAFPSLEEVVAINRAAQR